MVKKMDGYLFNCDLIHDGAINDNKDSFSNTIYLTRLF